MNPLFLKVLVGVGIYIYRVGKEIFRIILGTGDAFWHGLCVFYRSCVDSHMKPSLGGRQYRNLSEDQLFCRKIYWRPGP